MSSTRHRIHNPWYLRDTLNRFLDGCAVVGGVLLAPWLCGAELSRDFALAGAVAVLLFYLVAEISGMYRDWRGSSIEREIGCALWTWGFCALVLLVIGYLTQTINRFPQRAVIAGFLAAPGLIALGRIAVRAVQRVYRARGYNLRGMAIVGVNELAFQLAQNIDKSPELGLRLVGFYDDRPESRTPEVPERIGHRVGTMDDLVADARAGNVAMIYIALPMRAEQRIQGILDRLADSTASVYVVPDFFVFELLHSRWTTINGLPVVSVFENPFHGIDGLSKRLLDVVLASLFLILLAVPMAAIAAAVKLTSPGPVLFRQKRYGLDGREIQVWKFRSMRVLEDGAVVRQATREDPRVTPLGKFLRRSSLDELPQLFNVLQGTMSLVGPRPHATAHNEHYRSKIRGYMLRHKVKPGITGLAQVNGCRGETDTLDKMENRVKYDHRYIREWSLWMDLKILLDSVRVVFSKQNAY